MKTTRYFEEQVLRKRPYIEPDMCLTVLSAPLRQDRQEDGRICHWAEIIDQRDRVPRILRVVILEDGVTIHNAFFDRNVRKDQ